MVGLLAMAIALLTLNSVVYSYHTIGDPHNRALYYFQSPSSLAQTMPNNCSKCFTRPGRRGPRGLRGIVGATGPPGSIDVTLIDNLQEKMTSDIEDVVLLLNRTAVLEHENKEMTKVVERNQVKIRNLKMVNAQIKDQLRCTNERGGVAFDGKCYFVHDTTATFSAAKSACSGKDATFAPITSVGAYDTVIGYLRRYLIKAESSSMNFRIAMTYDPMRGDRNLTSLDGETFGFDKWYPSSSVPYKHSTSYNAYTTVRWYVYRRPSYSSQGFLNLAPADKYRPLCAKSI